MFDHELHDATPDDYEWLAQQFDGLTTELRVVTPSQWTEEKRYLPKAMTPIPGPFRFAVTPYLREIVDCFAMDSPIREVALMKGVQLAATTGVLENIVGFCIDHAKSLPMMLVTADAELAKLRLENNIIPMLQLSGLDHLIRSSDEGNARKTGKTDKKIEWVGGGFLLPFGAQNANKMRAIPIQVMLRDEVDGWPLIAGRDGDPMKLTEDRTAAFEKSRKILDLSTPTIEGISAIAKRFARGDQRRYFVRCLKCSYPQTLRWRRTSAEGEVTGFIWETTEDGRLAPNTVRYLCRNCAHPHINEDKTRLLSPDYGAEWRPTAVPATPLVRSYHISALYSPPAMQSWEACVQKWLEAWDDKAGIARDNEVLQVFYNNVLGEPFKLRGTKLRFEQVSAHRRSEYRLGEIPNKWAARYCGSHVLVLTCTVDVHKDNLAVSVHGWCRDRRPLLTAYERFYGNTENIKDPGTWVRLGEMIDQTVYAVADDGKKYRLGITLVDSGYEADVVYQFCQQWDQGVYPVKGRAAPTKAAKFDEFGPFETTMGTIGYGITVDMYKDRWAAALKREWDGQNLQPDGHYNAPGNLPDKALKELTAETKVEKRDKATGKLLGFEWRRPSGAANELWDCLIYASAAFDILAWDACCNQLEMDAVSLVEFYRICETDKPFYSE